MPAKKRTRKTVKKTVSFSDDTTLTTHQNREKKNVDHDRPPVYVRKTPLMTFPYHLVALLYYYVFVSSNFNTVKLLSFLIPTQVAYLVLQFNKCTVYGNKIIKINYSLTIICLSVTFLLSFPTMLLTILFGAPLMDLLWETWLLSLHFAFLAYPAVYSVFNCDFKVGLWKKYFIFIVVGGWISCVVIPLDWDRDWQNWPIPIVVGGYLGALVGYTIGAYI
ncbi:CQS_1a_G0041380.mRNA.1.CDS.1 [Saccharomyces cerevisiae]|nr:CQS_1a_G0041380.mRNA.1.CDS.1 [Saccharomyces cerevisiae]CAI7426827.1 CQS_1a_G0041380.mRNA.1.CDS.1 [Saccharomyces cerevisiae]